MSPNQYVGAYFEIYGALLLNATRVDSFFTKGHDWLLDGYRVNAKAAALKYDPRDNRPHFVFKLHLCHYSCEFYWLVGYKMRRGKPFPIKSWLIPSSAIPQRYITLGLSDKNKLAGYEMPLDLNLLKSAKFKRAIKVLKISEACNAI